MRDPKRIRVALTQVPGEDDGADEIVASRELPNGGARVLSRGEAAAAAAAAATKEPMQQSGDVHPDLGGDPPLLTESAESLTESAESLTESAESAESADDRSQTARQSGQSASTEQDRPAATGAMKAQPRGAIGENLDLLQGIMSNDSGMEGDNDDAGKAPPEVQEVLMLHVVARNDTGFPGNDILQVLLAYELRFGEMDFFHRHDNTAGRGQIQFSVANMLQPGVFDIDAMDAFSTPGLIFFLSLPGPSDMMAAFELMLETAQGVAEHLEGDVLDETRSVTTRQTLEHMRQRIRDLERKLLTQGKR